MAELTIYLIDHLPVREQLPVLEQLHFQIAALGTNNMRGSRPKKCVTQVCIQSNHLAFCSLLESRICPQRTVETDKVLGATVPNYPQLPVSYPAQAPVYPSSAQPNLAYQQTTYTNTAYPYAENSWVKAQQSQQYVATSVQKSPAEEITDPELLRNGIQAHSFLRGTAGAVERLDERKNTLVC